jgi:hypothetical protein
LTAWSKFDLLSKFDQWMSEARRGDGENVAIFRTIFNQYLGQTIETA